MLHFTKAAPQHHTLPSALQRDTAWLQCSCTQSKFLAGNLTNSGPALLCIHGDLICKHSPRQPTPHVVAELGRYMPHLGVKPPSPCSASLVGTQDRRCGEQVRVRGMADTADRNSQPQGDLFTHAGPGLHRIFRKAIQKCSAQWMSSREPAASQNGGAATHIQ